MKRTVVNTLAGKVILIIAVMPHVGMIRSHIDRIGGNGHRSGESHLLPAGGGLIGECSRREKLSGIVPQVTDVGAAVGAGFIETDAGDGTRGIGAEFNPEFNRTVRA